MAATRRCKTCFAPFRPSVTWNSESWCSEYCWKKALDNPTLQLHFYGWDPGSTSGDKKP